ncbi:phosphoglycerate mutase family protein [Aestuariibacter sp. AA17]|uniref:Phosphoglycerate mutase family protein n=1 Tax=Fluctibacter corallii TaxID=2984329 RepID=A0ABT3A8Q5_9ALTE|nr:histidine phosphatase family protein [Aestuariibacter sp. AA17]MCV2884972.1 phosphoglycerate mutase family protein [Aestuariibacter sp. AA17]
MTSVYLIRHGQASFGQRNYDLLSPLGEAQSHRVGTALSPRLPSIDAVYMGSMKRHQQTAQGCLSAMGMENLSPTVDAGWNEYDHQQILHKLADEFATPEGIQTYVKAQPNPKAAFEQLFASAVERWMRGHHDADYDESFNEFKTRVDIALSTLLRECQDKKHVVVFTSGGPISMVIQSLMNTDITSLAQLNWTLVNCGITKLVKTQTRLFLSTLNEHSHFEGSHNHMITYK